ncbi:hypothetical protein NST99_21555 [Paenibacillus sp. FSL L8-0470]|uniref:hypothetical protein n=1 Tax=unclassified Paenibacillus TaxID=185978 RepID=UPI0030F7AC54
MDLPANWGLDTSDPKVYVIKDEQGEARGEVSASEFVENFDFKKMAMPNHSSLTSEEELDIPMGTSRLFTLDADNGSAASGLTGTHDTYYAVIPHKEEILYILNFSNNDKAAETKQEFIGILTSLRIKDTRIKSIRLECADLCKEGADKSGPFTEKTFTDEHELEVFANALNKAVKINGELNYVTCFLMHISYLDGTQKKYVLNISDSEQEGITGLLVDTEDSGQGYEIPERIHNELRALIY